MTVDYAEAQFEIAALANLERQAERTAAALERVRDLMREVAVLEQIQKSEVRSRKSRQRRSKTA